MKIVCNREKLLHAFSIAASVVKPQSTKPILKNVKMEVDENSAILLGTDMEIGIRIQVQDVTVERPGSVILPVDRFGALLKESPEEQFTLESTENQTLVTAGRNTFKFPTENPEEFPPITTFDEPDYISLPARFLKEGIRRTNYATDTESGRYALGGVRFDLEGKTLYFVATDGRRLAKQEVTVQTVGDIPEQLAVIATPRSLQVIERILGNTDDEVLIAFRGASLLLKTQDTVLYSILLEGRYPDWRMTLKRSAEPRKIELPVRPFFSAIRQAAIVADKLNPGILMEFSEGKLVLSCSSAELGESRLEVPVGYDESESLSVKLNPFFITEFLRTLDPEAVVTMNIVDSQKGVTLVTTDGYLYLIMPLARDRA